jgi:hypothetical protein
MHILLGSDELAEAFGATAPAVSILHAPHDMAGGGSVLDTDSGPRKMLLQSVASKDGSNNMTESVEIMKKLIPLAQAPCMPVSTVEELDAILEQPQPTVVGFFHSPPPASPATPPTPEAAYAAKAEAEAEAAAVKKRQTEFCMLARHHGEVGFAVAGTRQVQEAWAERAQKAVPYGATGVRSDASEIHRLLALGRDSGSGSGSGSGHFMILFKQFKSEMVDTSHIPADGSVAVSRDFFRTSHGKNRTLVVLHPRPVQGQDEGSGKGEGQVATQGEDSQEERQQASGDTVAELKLADMHQFLSGIVLYGLGCGGSVWKHMEVYGRMKE